MAINLLPPALPEQWAVRIESQFVEIWNSRMTDVPVINDRLKVEAVGFRQWQGRVLGVLVTPWFMNLMLLPGADDDWSSLQAGGKRSFAFDAGAFEFVAGSEEGIGSYMSCSLFSPMFEFENHEAAVATAEASIEAIFDQQNVEKLGSVGLDDEPEVHPAGELIDGLQTVAEATHRNLDRPVSRRELLRGSFLRPEKKELQQQGE